MHPTKLGLGICLVVAGTAGMASAQSLWTVCHDGTCDFVTIQSAINHAADGDIVQISAGTFTEGPIAIHDRDITIAGSTTGATELSGNFASRIISITGSSSVRLRNLVFTRGRARGENGGAIRFSALKLDISDCRFHDNRAGTGGAIFAEGGRVHVVSSEFTQNAAQGVSFPVGGAMLLAGTTTTLARCLFENNSAAYAGGAVRQIAGSMLATSSIFKSNSSLWGGALEVYAHGFALTIVNCTLVNNTGNGASAIKAYYATVRLVNTIVSGNGLLLRTSYGGGFTGAHSLVSHGHLPGWGNSVGDPMLSASLEPLPGSPCLDAGTARVMLSEFDVLGSGSSCFAYAYDFYGGPRFRDAGASQAVMTGCPDDVSRVDIGAVEGAGSPRPAPRIGDLTGDGAVDGSDLALLLSNWGNSTCSGDLNADGEVGGLDLSDLLGSWGACKRDENSP